MATVSVVAALFFAVNVYALYHYFSDRMLDDELVAIWEQKLDQQQHALEDVRVQSDERLRALTRRIATLQSQLLRVEALGDRVADIAGLEGEFDFNEVPALGGPETSDSPYQPPQFVSLVDELALNIEDRRQQLEVLESLLLEDDYQNQTEIRGWPLKRGWMSSGYGRRIDPITGKLAWHSGMDFAGSAGSEVMALASGVVTYAGYRRGYGEMIEVYHGEGLSTRYAHHESLLVDTGDIVKTGQAIALVGSTGRSTGPHVHFEVLKNGRPIDPAPYIQWRRL
jgi:murein DD-endopeptidase MepM/ murein hydrolase activator NlpD